MGAALDVIHNLIDHLYTHRSLLTGAGDSSLKFAPVERLAPTIFLYYRWKGEFDPLVGGEPESARFTDATTPNGIAIASRIEDGGFG